MIRLLVLQPSQGINKFKKINSYFTLYNIFIYTSPALGLGWRLGFLGLLHLDVFNQRLEQEYNAQAIMTAPSVTYKGLFFLNFEKFD